MLEDQAVEGAKSRKREGRLRMRLGTGNLEKGKGIAPAIKAF
jgi:hypothetical protein